MEGHVRVVKIRWRDSWTDPKIISIVSIGAELDGVVIESVGFLVGETETDFVLAQSLVLANDCSERLGIVKKQILEGPVDLEKVIRVPGPYCHRCGTFGHGPEATLAPMQPNPDDPTSFVLVQSVPGSEL